MTETTAPAAFAKMELAERQKANPAAADLQVGDVVTATKAHGVHGSPADRDYFNITGTVDKLMGAAIAIRGASEGVEGYLLFADTAAVEAAPVELDDEEPDREPSAEQERGWDERDDDARGHTLTADDTPVIDDATDDPFAARFPIGATVRVYGGYTGEVTGYQAGRVIVTRPGGSTRRIAPAGLDLVAPPAEAPTTRDDLRPGQALFHRTLGLWVTVDDTPADWPSTGVCVRLGNGDRLAAEVADLQAGHGDAVSARAPEPADAGPRRIGDELSAFDVGPRRISDAHIRTCDECAGSTSALETSLCTACRRAKGWEDDEPEEAS